MKIDSVLSLSCCFVACSLLASPLAAQTTFGSITGTVTDPTGAVIPGVSVIVTNEGTNVERQVTSTSSGTFNVPNLPVGSYRLRIEVPGFVAYEQRAIALNANQVLNVNAQMAALSGAATTVEVSGTVGVIDTETSTLSYPKNNADMENLPLVSRSAGDFGIYGFTYSNPGVSLIAAQRNPTVNGNRILDTTLTLDGIVVMAYVSGMGGGPSQPSIEGIQQVNIELAGTPAEFARSADFTVVTKSGTNAFHGTAYYDYNGDRLNARDFFASIVPFRVYNDFAGSVGGPIIKNKTFFFFNYEGSREAATITLVGNTPLVPWRSGDFSGLSTTIIDPTTGQPFPNNQIPANRISPVSEAVENYFYPLPNYGSPTLQSGNWRGQRPSQTGYTHYNDYGGRVDENLTSKDAFFVHVGRRTLPHVTQDTTALLPPVGVTDEVRATASTSASWTHSLSPTMVNEMRGGFVRMHQLVPPTLIGSSILSQVGIEGVPTVGVPNPPGFNITGITTTQLSSADHLNIDTNFEATDNLSLTRGAHFLKFGADYIHDQVSGYAEPTSVYGTYNFTGAYTDFGYADFLLGIPQTTALSVPIPENYFHGNVYGLYAQDQFKVGRKLTLNYGLRYEIQTPYSDIHGNSFSFDPSKEAIVVPSAGITNINPFYPKNLPIITASQAGYPGGSLINTRYTNFYPRFGFAYKPFSSDKTVLRGGYGIYGDSVLSSLAFYDMVGGPFSGSQTFTNKLVSGVPLFQFPSPFLASGTTATQNISGVNPNLYVPYSQQITLTLEQQLGQVGIRIGYVRTQTVGLLYSRNINQPVPSTIPYSPSRLYTDPAFNVITYYDNGGSEQYNALQISAAKNIGKNLSFNSGFVWAKDLTDTQTTGAFSVGPLIQNQFCRRCDRGPNAITRPLRGYINAVYALPIGHDQRFLSHVNGVVDAFLGGWNTSWVSEMEKGQYFTPTYSTFDPSNTNNFGPSASYVARPDVVLNPPAFSGQSINNWFNAAAFAVPGCPATTPVCSNPAPVGRFGNAGVNTLEGPNLVNFDFSASKYFRIREKMRLQFRMLATNIFNHPNFALPAYNISSPATDAKITSTFGEQLGETSRQIHFSLRLEF